MLTLIKGEGIEEFDSVESTTVNFEDRILRQELLEYIEESYDYDTEEAFQAEDLLASLNICTGSFITIFDKGSHHFECEAMTAEEIWEVVVEESNRDGFTDHYFYSGPRYNHFERRKRVEGSL